ADAWELLETAPAVAASSQSRFGSAAIWAGLAGVLAVAAGVGVWGPWGGGETVEHPLGRLDVHLGPDVALPPAHSARTFQISPDGTRLVYLSGNPVKLYLRNLNESKSTELPGSEGAELPFFSPDSRWVAFVAGGRLYKIPVEGGTPSRIGDLSQYVGSD